MVEPSVRVRRRSKDDVLLEEIQFLRQLLADSNEEKRIEAATVAGCAGVLCLLWVQMKMARSTRPLSIFVGVSQKFIIRLCFSYVSVVCTG